MSVHIIIDGYNLIRQSQALASLDQQDMQLGREALIDMLSAYKKIRPHAITVVFDAAGAPDFIEPQLRAKGIGIRFSRRGESADEVIKRMLAREKERALVVSSDREITRFAETCQAAVISSEEFENRLAMASYSAVKGAVAEGEEENGWEPTTRKKGPQRRRSKRERRNQVKLKKL
ncbi:MAG: NYN domain-containing protein [Thermodesulfobacteriota bacterium]